MSDGGSKFTVPNWTRPARKESVSVPKVQAHNDNPSSDVCLVCGSAILTQCFKGTDACSDRHLKELYGSAALPKVHASE